MTDAGYESPWKPFERHMSPQALAAFEQGPLNTVLAICRNAIDRYPAINIHLRGDGIDVYEGGSRIAGLRSGTHRRVASLTIADGYLRGTPLSDYAGEDVVDLDPVAPLKRRERSKLCVIPIDDGFAEKWRAHIDAVIARSREIHRNPEGRWEAKVLAANQAGTPVEFLDRQVQAPRKNKQAIAPQRVDAIALANVDGCDACIVVELKQKEDARIWKLYDQATKYLVMLGGANHELRQDVAECYRQMAAQRAQLGLTSVAPERICTKMPMYGLVVLADYNQNSSRLAAAAERAAEAEARGGPPIYVHVLGDDCVLPGWPWVPLSKQMVSEVARRRWERRHARGADLTDAGRGSIRP